MRRTIARAVACFALTSSVSGADPAPEVIVIDGLRLPRTLVDTPAATTVIDRVELSTAVSAVADEIVRTVPTVGTFRRSSSLVADPTSQGLNLRGVGPSGVSRALVLRDGIPENDPFGGWVYWRAISPLALQRIEITPSGASALFGNFALGGAVELVDRPIDRRSLSMLIAGGSYATERAAVHASEQRGSTAIGLDVDVLTSGGYAPIVNEQRGAVDGRAPSTHAAVAARAEQTIRDSLLFASARWFTESLDAGTAHTSSDVTVFAGTAGWRQGDLTLTAFGGVQRFTQERARVSPDRETADSASRQRTPSHNLGASGTWRGRLARQEIVVGADLQYIAGHADDALTPPTVTDSTIVRRSAGGQQWFAGAYAQDAIRATSRLEVIAALRVDAWGTRDATRSLVRGNGDREQTLLATTGGTEIDPRIGLLGHVTDEFALRVSGYRAFRAPTLNELFRPFQVGTILTDANDQLHAESLWGAEAGPQIAVSQVLVRATAFWNRLNGAISNVTLASPSSSGATRQRRNLGAARIAGLELDASWHPTPTWILGVAYLVDQTEVVDAGDQPMLRGKRLPQAPRQRASAEIAFDDPRFATVSVDARYLGTQFEDDLNTLPIGAAVVVDARVARRLYGGLSAFASVTNVFDRTYLVGRAGIDTQGAPRMFELGLILD